MPKSALVLFTSGFLLVVGSIGYWYVSNKKLAPNTAVVQTTASTQPNPTKNTSQKNFYERPNIPERVDQYGKIHPAYYLSIRGIESLEYSNKEGKTGSIQSSAELEKMFPILEKYQTKGRATLSETEKVIVDKYLKELDPPSDITVHRLGEYSSTLIIPDDAEYTITMSPSIHPGGIELYYGYGDPETAEMRMVYNDLMLIKDKSARIIINTKGITPIISQDDNGNYKNIFEPTSVTYGDAAKDTTGPEIKVSTEKNANQDYMVIDASDPSGTKEVHFTFEKTEVGKSSKFEKYSNKVVIPTGTTEVSIFADDSIGNRSFITHQLFSSSKN